MSKETRNKVIELLQGHGWSKEQSVGMAANLHAESTFNPKAVGDGGKAYGLAQWHPDRQAVFQKQFGKPIRQSTLEEQVAFMNYELREGNERAAGKKLLATKDAASAADVVTRHYERPLDKDGEASKRSNLARQWVGLAPVAAPVMQAKTSQSTQSAGTAPATSVLPQASQVAQGGVLDVSGILPGFEAWLAPQQPQAMAQQQMPVIPDMPVAKDYWGEYLASLQSQGNKPVTSIFDMQQPPDFFSALAGLAANDPNFEEFGGLG